MSMEEDVQIIVNEMNDLIDLLAAVEIENIQDIDELNGYFKAIQDSRSKANRFKAAYSPQDWTIQGHPTWNRLEKFFGQYIFS